ncbi:MAG TPA: hypothetical protein VJ927_04770 [Actinomycetota bacterium]|nr:hypothetical protein [Actinomycetota bacterium]
MADNSFGCPQCGHRVPYGTPTCGNCGNDLRPYFRNSPYASPASSASPRAIGLLALLLLVGGGIFLFRAPVDEFIDELGDRVDEIQDTIPDGGEEVEVTEEFGPRTRGYRHIPALVRDLRAGGLPCRDTVVDTSDKYLETGSCQSNGTHVQINIYLEPSTLEGAEEIFQDWPFDTAHKDNWWVITSRPVAREAARILGARFTKAS